LLAGDVAKSQQWKASLPVWLAGVCFAAIVVIFASIIKREFAMKLETILNAYGQAMRRDGYLDGECPTGFVIPSRYTRQAEKFKMRLLSRIRLIDTMEKSGWEIAFNNKDYEWPIISRMPDGEPIYLQDINHYCGECYSKMQIVRPGKWQCPNCE
jgi:hypothetical protein